MFSVIVKAQTMPELGKKLGEAAAAIMNGCEVHSANVSFQDTNPIPAGVSHSEDMARQMADEVDDEPQTVAINMDAVRAQQSSTVDNSVGTVEIDSRGIPWDERIHAGSHTKNKDGSWRNRRGVDDALVQQIESASRQGGASNSATAPAPIPAAPSVTPVFVPVAQNLPPIPGLDAAVAPPAPVAVPPQPVFTSAPSVSANTQSSVPVSAPAGNAPGPVASTVPSYENIPIPQTTKPAHSLETFKQSQNFVNTLATLVAGGKLKQDYIELLKAHFGVKEIFDVVKNDAQIAEIFNTFVKAGLITQVG